MGKLTLAAKNILEKISDVAKKSLLPDDIADLEVKGILVAIKHLKEYGLDEHVGQITLYLNAIVAKNANAREFTNLSNQWKELLDNSKIFEVR